MRAITSNLRRHPRVATLLLGCALVLLPAQVWSATTQSDALAEMQKKLDQSLQAIEALTKRVSELEGKLAASKAGAGAAAPVAPNPPAPENARLDTAEQRIEQLERENASRNSDDTGLPLHGFADVGVGTRNPINPDLRGFYVGNLDFYLTPHLGDRTRALFELNTEVGSDGSVSVDLERAQIGYQFSDLATVWLGRFHTPYGYVNTSLHHGAWVNNTLRRPKFLQFEDNGGILPAHTVGLWATGAMRGDTGRVLYDAYIGNSQHIVDGVLNMQNAGTSNGQLMGGGRIGYQSEGSYTEGLTLGLHALTARVLDEQLDSTTRLLVYGGYAVYDTDRWESIAELYLFNNQDQSFGTGTHHSTAGFAQVGYRTAWGLPYVRYERASLSQADPYFYGQISGGSYWRGALGVRFDIDLKSAIKLELADTSLSDRSGYPYGYQYGYRYGFQYGEGLVQYAIRF